MCNKPRLSNYCRIKSVFHRNDVVGCVPWKHEKGNVEKEEIKCEMNLVERIGGKIIFVYRHCF